MAAQLLGTVFVDGDIYPAGTAATAELRKLITNPVAWSEPAEPPAESEEPPRGGAGATAEAWRKYAEGRGQTVPPGAGRDEIIAQLIAAGLIEKE